MPKGRPRKQTSTPASNATPAPSTQQPSSSRPRRRNQHGASQPATRAFAVLKPRVRQISQATIATKWPLLSAPAQQRAREILTAAKRSVVTSHWDERRRAEAESAISGVVRKVERRLGRMPVPPRTREWVFDAERVGENSRLLEGRLTSAMHAVELLKAEIRKEENALEVDRGRYAELQANAKAEYKELTKQASKAHPLLRVAESNQGEDTAEAIRLRKPTSKAAIRLDDADSDIASLMQQFSSHLDHMSANYEQVNGLREGILEAQMELDRVLPHNSDFEGLG
ncbi:hypothetical protein EV356DRAFT_533887 [Viridothelium virens]|uniref:Kinetochore protein fta7 n=1 Tax=Viridothelium virens TaxID=1048519 RepID=A0A6A6H6U9_VIRVR|nr:hypothetical protein EV356DRAFT_533887 [Viridothelium virens]